MMQLSPHPAHPAHPAPHPARLCGRMVYAGELLPALKLVWDG